MNETLIIASVAAVLAVIALVALVYAIVIGGKLNKVKLQLVQLTDQVQRETKEVVICRHCGSPKGVMETVCPTCKK